MIICPKCEEKNINDRKFCKKCGYLLAGCIQVDSSLVTNYKPTELRIADYSLSTDLAICKAVNKLPIIKSAVEKLITYWNLPMEKRKLLGDAVKVDKNQLNSIYELVEYSSRVLNIAIPEVYVKYDPQFNAYTYGTNDDNVIVLNSSLVDTFTQDELLFVIGHEMGHIKSQHVTYLSIGSLLSTGYSAFSKFWFNPLRVPLDAWSREAEFSVDRAGYLVSQDKKATLSALIMFALGSRQLLSEFDMGKYLEQEELLGDFYGIFNKWFGGYSHPYTVERVNRILDFMYSDNAIEISKKIKSNFKTRFIPNIVPADNHERKAVFCSVCGMEIESNTDICAFCGNEV